MTPTSQAIPARIYSCKTDPTCETMRRHADLDKLHNQEEGRAVNTTVLQRIPGRQTAEQHIQKGNVDDGRWKPSFNILHQYHVNSALRSRSLGMTFPRSCALL
jgi:hypothetical protein